jgi:hypothetical protein
MNNSVFQCFRYVFPTYIGLRLDLEGNVFSFAETAKEMLPAHPDWAISKQPT